MIKTTIISAIIADNPKDYKSIKERLKTYKHSFAIKQKLFIEKKKIKLKLLKRYLDKKWSK